LKNINSQIEPIMLICLGVLLVIFALGIFLPMWDLGSIVVKK
jgi:MSHA biogenesis protein MshG